MPTSGRLATSASLACQPACIDSVSLLSEDEDIAFRLFHAEVVELSASREALAATMARYARAEVAASGCRASR